MRINQLLSVAAAFVLRSMLFLQPGSMTLHAVSPQFADAGYQRIHQAIFVTISNAIVQSFDYTIHENSNVIIEEKKRKQKTGRTFVVEVAYIRYIFVDLIHVPFAIAPNFCIAHQFRIHVQFYIFH